MTAGVANGRHMANGRPVVLLKAAIACSKLAGTEASQKLLDLKIFFKNIYQTRLVCKILLTLKCWQLNNLFQHHYSDEYNMA